MPRPPGKAVAPRGSASERSPPPPALVVRRLPGGDYGVFSEHRSEPLTVVARQRRAIDWAKTFKTASCPTAKLLVARVRHVGGPGPRDKHRRL